MTTTFRRAVVEHSELLLALATNLCGDPVDAEDLVQDTFARALRSWSQHDSASSLRAWLVRIQRNLYIDHYRRTRRSPELVPVDDADALGELATRGGALEAIEESLGDDVQAALDRLSEPLRTAVWLADVEGWSHAEIAESMGCALGTVKSRVHRARAALAAHLARRAVAPERAQASREGGTSS